MRDWSLRDRGGWKDSLHAGARGWGLVLVAIVYLALISCGGTSQPTPITTPVQRPSPTSEPTRTATPTVTATATTQPTLEPLSLPTPPAGGQFITFSPDPNRTGWLASGETRAHWRDRSMFSGVYGGQTYDGIVQFDLSTLSPNSKIYFAALEITGRDASIFSGKGKWSFDLIDSQVVKDDSVTFDAVDRTPSLGSLATITDPKGFGPGQTQRLTFPSDQLQVVQKQLEIGDLTVRLRGPTDSESNLFGWNAATGPGEPTLFLLVVPSPFVVITSAPTSENVFAAATRSAQETAQAASGGAPTRLSRAFITATPGPAKGIPTAPSGYFVYTAVPTPFNAQDVHATAVYATAVAMTTGTFTPFPSNWVTATPAPLIIPRLSLTPQSTPTITATPLPGLVDIAKRPLPPGFFNKIIFMEGPRSNPNFWVMEPNGNILGLLTDRSVYDIAKARDSISPDGTQMVYQEVGQNGMIQLLVKNFHYPGAPPAQITFVNRGIVYGQAWSPDGKKIAYVSDEFQHQEIYVWDFDLKKSVRLTYALGSGGDKSGWWWNQFPSWSPDGKQIVYSTDRGHDATFSEIWVMNADGSNQKDLGEGVWDAYNPVWVKWQR